MNPAELKSYRLNLRRFLNSHPKCWRSRRRVPIWGSALAGGRRGRTKHHTRRRPGAPASVPRRRGSGGTALAIWGGLCSAHWKPGGTQTLHGPVVSPESRADVQPPVPADVTQFENRVLADLTDVGRGRNPAVLMSSHKGDLDRETRGEDQAETEPRGHRPGSRSRTPRGSRLGTPDFDSGPGTARAAPLLFQGPRL